MIDLRHESVHSLLGAGWTLRRIAAALELTWVETLKLADRADAVHGLRSVMCRCTRVARGRTPSEAMAAALDDGWTHTRTGHLRCRECAAVVGARVSPNA